MRQRTELFQVNGQPMPVPDGRVKITETEILDAQSGQDEKGIMHRFPRGKVRTWHFFYRHLTEEDRQYLEGIFPATGVFTFSHPAGEGVCYRTDYSIVFQNAPEGLWGDCNFRITEQGLW